MFSQRLSAIRKMKNLNQKDVSDSLHLERSTYSGYESGKSKPSLKKLIELADFFNVSTDYLLGRTDNPLILNVTYDIEDDIDLYTVKISEDISTWDKYVSMDANDKKAVNEFIDARMLLNKSNKTEK